MGAVSVPYVGSIDGGLSPGKMVRIQGSSLPSANRFAINIQTGPNLHPRDDIVLHISAIFAENVLSRASLQGGVWGPEERTGALPFSRGQSFEILVLCDSSAFKIAVNGQHFTEFEHRIAYHLATHLVIEGDIDVSHIVWEGGSVNNLSGPSVGFMPPATSEGMYSLNGVGGAAPYPTNPANIPPYSGPGYVPPPPPGAVPYATPGGYTTPQSGYGPPQGGYVPSHPVGYGTPQPGGYGAPQTGGYGASYAPGYGPPNPHGYPQQPAGYAQPGYGQPGYPPPPPGYSDPNYPSQTSNNLGFLGKAGTALMGALGTAGVLGALSGGGPSHKSGGMLNKVGAALGVGAGAAVLGSVLKGKSHGHGYPGGHGGGVLGKVGTALGVGTGAAALGGVLGGKKAHKKAKKAAKYGIPVAGLGLGAYALHKGVKGFHGGSSSSSSSSEEE